MQCQRPARRETTVKLHADTGRHLHAQPCAGCCNIPRLPAVVVTQSVLLAVVRTRQVWRSYFTHVAKCAKVQAASSQSGMLPDTRPVCIERLHSLQRVISIDPDLAVRASRHNEALAGHEAGGKYRVACARRTHDCQVGISWLVMVERAPVIDRLATQHGRVYHTERCRTVPCEPRITPWTIPDYQPRSSCWP